MRAVIILMLIERLVTKGTIIIARPPVTHNHAETRCVASHVDLDLKVQGVLTPTNLFCRAFPITLPIVSPNISACVNSAVSGMRLRTNATPALELNPSASPRAFQWIGYVSSSGRFIHAHKLEAQIRLKRIQFRRRSALDMATIFDSVFRCIRTE